eukprot:2394966-Amphidinium_carterae.1
MAADQQSWGLVGGGTSHDIRTNVIRLVEANVADGKKGGDLKNCDDAGQFSVHWFLPGWGALQTFVSEDRCSSVISTSLSNQSENVRSEQVVFHSPPTRTPLTYNRNE